MALIGVFDSGVGGLSILKALLAELPSERFIYFADAGHAPYGEKSGHQVLARSRAVTDYLLSQGVQALVVACNTATAAAIDSLRADHPDLPIIGVEPGLKPAHALSQTRRIGVMATQGTLESPRFKRLLKSFGDDAVFTLRACSGLAMAIEQSTHVKDMDPAGDAEVRASCEQHIRSMGAFGTAPGQIDTLVLGCTHYPFALPVLRELVGPAVRFIDPGEPVARQTRHRLEAAQAMDSGPAQAGGSSGAQDATLRLETSGKAADLQMAAERWLGLPAGALARTVDLSAQPTPQAQCK